MDKDKEFVLKQAHDTNVKFIRLWFTDILGFLKSFAITIEEFEDALYEGVRFDGSTLQGSARRDEEEMIALPDPSTFKILPWRPREDSVARIICDIYKIDMTPYEADSRYILKKHLKKASDKGLKFYTGPEIEFFLFKDSYSPETLDCGGYFDLTPLDLAADYRRQTVLTLEEMDINVISSHHEASHSQHEIDLRHEDALSTADNIMTFRLITKEVALNNGIYASFMPKPLAGQNGSGMHIHQSLFKDEVNLFFNPDGKYLLSSEGEKYIAGLLKHSHEFFLLTNQWINSYKRLVEGYESPTHISWGQRNPAAFVRVPNCRKDKPESMRIELRNPDPSCNPYLVFSSILSAGLSGIENNYKLPPSIDESRSNEHHFHPLPGQLTEALSNFESSNFMKDVLGNETHSLVVENKKEELDRYNNYITDYEIKEYLPRL